MTDRPRLRPLQPLWVDAVLAFAVVAAQIAGTEILVRTAGSDRPMDVVAYGLLAASGAAIAFRDRAPVAVLFAVIGIVLAYTWLGYPGPFYMVSIVFAIWAAVAAGHRLVSITASATLVAAVVLASYVVPTGHATDPDAPIWMTGWLVASLVLGEVSRGRRRYLEQVEQRALDAERTREEEARRRAGEERMRIARELHDVLAHNISTINVQAGVAAHLLDQNPGNARAALVTIEDASHEALDELRAIVGILREEDGEAPLEPAPALDAVRELVEVARGTGLDVTLETRGQPPGRMPDAVQLAAYRIVQESLTNVRRHAAGAPARVGLSFELDRLLVTVENDAGAASNGAGTGAGVGVIGMKERAAAVGGRLHAESFRDGFRVAAELPYRRAE